MVPMADSIDRARAMSLPTRLCSSRAPLVKTHEFLLSQHRSPAGGFHLSVLCAAPAALADALTNDRQPRLPFSCLLDNLAVKATNEFFDKSPRLL